MITILMAQIPGGSFESLVVRNDADEPVKFQMVTTHISDQELQDVSPKNLALRYAETGFIALRNASLPTETKAA